MVSHSKRRTFLKASSYLVAMQLRPKIFSLKVFKFFEIPNLYFCRRHIAWILHAIFQGLSLTEMYNVAPTLVLSSDYTGFQLSPHYIDRTNYEAFGSLNFSRKTLKIFNSLAFRKRLLCCRCHLYWCLQPSKMTMTIKNACAKSRNNSWVQRKALFDILCHHHFHVVVRYWTSEWERRSRVGVT